LHGNLINTLLHCYL